GPGRRGERARERAPDAVLEVPLGGGGAGEPRALARRRVPEPQELVRERPEEDDGGADASEREGDAGGRARDDVVLRDGTGRGAAGYGRRAGRRGASGGRGHEVPPRVCGLRNGRRRGPAGCAARCRSSSRAAAVAGRACPTTVAGADPAVQPLRPDRVDIT